jgi:hypothetical protein
MFDHIPYGDDVEGTWRQIHILKSTTDDVGEAKRIASISHGCWRNLTTIRFPVRIRRHGLQKKSESTPHVEKSARAPDEKSFEEVLMHSTASLVPIEMVTRSDFLAPKLIIVRVSSKRREDMMTPAAAQNVSAKLVENGAMPQPSTQQTPQGGHAAVYSLYHVLLP